MALNEPARQRFLSLIRQTDEQVPLATTALSIAWEDQGGPDPEPILGQFDRFVADLRPLLDGVESHRSRIAIVNRYLFTEQGFYGDPRCYEQPDPANSYLDRVLERRTGLPIMLALIYLEVGWRLDLPVHGLALPGHFLVQWGAPGSRIFIDPFSGGSLWSLDDCERQISSFYGEAGPELVTWAMLPPARGAILARILRNLKQTYLARDHVRHALAAVERLLALDASDSSELRDRGLLRFRAGYTYPALIDLEEYTRRSPDASDVNQIRAFVSDLMAKFAALN
jgi:regulator of sirC expression with transglutaminase-like and TPR domain